MSLYLLFDVGNTRLKWAAVESSKHPSDRQKKLWAYSGSISSNALQSSQAKAELANYIAKTLPKPDAIGFCCVAGSQAITNLKLLFPQWSEIAWQQLHGESHFTGMRPLYQDPTKLGAGRWAALFGARALSKSNTLIINSGTATTIDLLGSNGVHYGGWILPGLSLMQTSLQSQTAQLPLAERHDGLFGFGINTNDAIINGCDAAQIGAIVQAIQISKKLNCPIEKIWLDGGNAKILEQIIAQSQAEFALNAEATEGLVLRGVWAWLLNSF